MRLWSPLREVVQFEALLEPRSATFIADHVVRDRVIMPAAGMIEMGLSAGRLAGSSTVEIENFVIAESLTFADDAARVVQTVVRIADGRAQSFELLSRPAGEGDQEWTLHAQGDFAPISALHPATPTLDGAREAAVSDHYEDWRVAVSPWVRVCASSRASALRTRRRQALLLRRRAAGYGTHPALLDGCLQVIAAAAAAGRKRHLPSARHRPHPIYARTDRPHDRIRDCSRPPAGRDQG